MTYFFLFSSYGYPRVYPTGRGSSAFGVVNADVFSFFFLPVCCFYPGHRYSDSSPVSINGLNKTAFVSSCVSDCTCGRNRGLRMCVMGPGEMQHVCGGLQKTVLCRCGGLLPVFAQMGDCICVVICTRNCVSLSSPSLSLSLSPSSLGTLSP